MRTFAAAAALTAGIAGTALGTTALGTTVLAPGLAAAATDSSTEAITERVAEITDALAGLVEDGSITQDQADEVAETLGDSDLGWGPRHGPGHGLGHGPGHGPGAAHLDPGTIAGILGITADELRTAVEEGQTLTQIAEDQGIARAKLVDELVAAAEAELAEGVDEGHLTQEQADELRTGLRDRIAAGVDDVPGPRPGRFGDPRPS
jgi:hypothetical protein